MGKLSTVGTPKAPLKQEPRNVLPENDQSPNLQKIGTGISLKDSPGPKYGAGTPDGMRQVVGTELKLNTTPRLGYESGTNMSERATDSKKNY